MKLKLGVNPFAIKPELLIALIVADGLWREHGQELVVTSLNDGKHSNQSLHYNGYAADLRTKYFDEQTQKAVHRALVLALGGNRDYDIVLESTHIHIEYQPKYRGA